MENTAQITDDKLLEIARHALANHFPADQIADVNLTLEKREPAHQSELESEPPVISVWVQHVMRTFLPNPAATLAANIEILSKLRDMNDNRTFLLFHGFPNDPARPKKVA